MQCRLLAAAAWLCLALPAAAQPASLDNFDAVKTSGAIVALLAQRDLDSAADTAARLMQGSTVEKLRDVFKLVNGLGQSQYNDLVYARDFGRTEKDVIYKIDFDKAFLFVRFLYHVDNGAWRLIHIHLKSENEHPLPKEWVHIYPK